MTSISATLPLPDAVLKKNTGHTGQLILWDISIKSFKDIIMLLKLPMMNKFAYRLSSYTPPHIVACYIIHNGPSAPFPVDSWNFFKLCIGLCIHIAILWAKFVKLYRLVALCHVEKIWFHETSQIHRKASYTGSCD